MTPKHMVMDLKDCKVDLSSLSNIKTYLSYICMALELTPRGAPLIDTFGGQPNGITALQILSTSSISIHTYPEHRSCNIDIFACSDFNQRVALKLSLAFFQSKGVFKMIERTIV